MRERDISGGDDPRKREFKKGRQLPDASLRNHEDGEGGSHMPHEIHRKEVRKKEQPIRSPRDAFEQSALRAQNLFDPETWSQYDEIGKLASLSALSNLARISAIQGDAGAIRELGNLMESVVPDHSTALTEIYFEAALIDDIEATDKLHGLLQKEKERTMTEGNSLYARGKRPRSESNERPQILALVRACAEKQLPADNWIDDYSLNMHDAARLKLAYLKATEHTEHEDQETAAQYRDEVTSQFLRGELNRDFSQNYIDELYLLQDDPHAKRLVFDQFREMNEQFLDQPTPYDKIISFYAFAKEYLTDPGIARPEDASWIWQTMNDLSTVSYAGAEDRFHPLVKHEQKAALAFARYMKAPAGLTVEALSDVVSKQLQRGNESEKGAIMGHRDNRLWECATEAVAGGDLESAKHFLGTTAYQSFAYLEREKAFFDSLQTPEALEAIKPDALTLAYNENLGEIFAALTGFLSDDAEEITEMTSSLLAKDIESNQRGNLANDLFEKGLASLYACDKEAAHTAARAYVDTVKKDNPYADDRIESIAEIQLAAGDPMGWQLLYDLAEKETTPDMRMLLHTRLALRAARAMQEEA